MTYITIEDWLREDEERYPIEEEVARELADRQADWAEEQARAYVERPSARERLEHAQEREAREQLRPERHQVVSIAPTGDDTARRVCILHEVAEKADHFRRNHRPADETLDREFLIGLAGAALARIEQLDREAAR